MIAGSVIVLGRNETVSLSLEGLSPAEATLVGDSPLVPGDRVRLLVHIDGERSFGVCADILSTEPVAGDSQRISVGFRDVDVETQAGIDAIVLGATRAVPTTAPRAALVMHGDRAAAAALDRDLGELGYFVISAATSNEFIDKMNDQTVRIEAVIIDAAHPRLNAAGVLAQLAEEHPKVIRILTTSSGYTGDSDTMIAARRANVVILAPWDRQTLGDALAA